MSNGSSKHFCEIHGVRFCELEMVLSTLATLGPLAWQGLKFINDRTNGKFGKYIGGKALEGGAYVTKKILNKVNSDKANAAAKKVAEVAADAAKEITGEDSDITKNITKAAKIIAPDATLPTQTVALQPLVNVDAIPYSKMLYGSNFQRYTPKHINRVELTRPGRRKRMHHGHRVLSDANATTT